eukprot:1158859-Pelagomonas_calceolata.AAC.3
MRSGNQNSPIMDSSDLCFPCRPCPMASPSAGWTTCTPWRAAGLLLRYTGAQPSSKQEHPERCVFASHRRVASCTPVCVTDHADMRTQIQSCASVSCTSARPSSKQGHSERCMSASHRRARRCPQSRSIQRYVCGREGLSQLSFALAFVSASVPLKDAEGRCVVVRKWFCASGWVHRPMSGHAQVVACTVQRVFVCKGVEQAILSSFAHMGKGMTLCTNDRPMCATFLVLNPAACPVTRSACAQCPD